LKKISKKVKTLIFSSSGLVILAAVLLLLKLTADEESTRDDIISEPELPHIHFTELDAEEVRIISVKNEFDEYMIAWGLSDRFMVSGLLNAPLNESRLHTAARYVSGFWVRDIVEENAENLEQYGLGDTAVQVSAVFKNDETINIYIGDKTPTAENMAFVRVGDDNNVYIVWSYMVDMFRESSLQFVSLDITGDYYSVGSPQIEKLTVERLGTERYVIELNPDVFTEEIVFNPHIFVEPAYAFGLEVDATRGQSVMHGLFGLTASSVAYVGEGLPRNLPEDSGFDGIFDEPVAYVEMIIDGVTYTLLVGERAVMQNENAEDILLGYYAFFSEQPDVLYVIPPEMLTWLNFDVESIMAVMFIRPYIYTVSDFIIETPSRVLNFRFAGDSRDNEVYYLDGEPVDTSAFKDLYIYAISVSATGLWSEEPKEFEVEPLLARYTFKYRDRSKPDTTLEFYDAGNMTGVVVLDGRPLFTVSLMYLNRLEQNIEAYLKGEPIINSW